MVGDRKKAVPVARAARRFAGAKADLSTTTAALHRAAASLGATLTADDVGIGGPVPPMIE
jgi:hypothetical protein